MKEAAFVHSQPHAGGDVFSLRVEAGSAIVGMAGKGKVSLSLSIYHSSSSSFSRSISSSSSSPSLSLSSSSSSSSLFALSTHTQSAISWGYVLVGVLRV